MDYNLPGSFVHGILQASMLERIAISFSRGSSLSKDQIRISCVSFIGGWIFTTGLPRKLIKDHRAVKISAIM